MFDFRPSFQNALPYEQFLATHGSGLDVRRWESVFAQVTLSPSQRVLLSSFRRSMQVLCMAGAWCGDCAAQCPILHGIAQASRTIDLRYVDRDADPRLADELMLCGSPRIPQVVFLDEEGNHVGRYGDRTLATYRQLNQQLAGAPYTIEVSSAGSLNAAATQDWLNEIERIQWLLRTSPRLRQRHGD